jgi:hypothetical protein
MESTTLTKLDPDLYRSFISTLDTIGLPAHVLRLLFERMVLVAAYFGAECTTRSSTRRYSIFMPIMSRIGSRYEAQFYNSDTVGNVPGVESGKG